LIGLDRYYEILSWPWAGFDPLRRSMQMQVQVIRIVVKIAAKALLDGKLGREAARKRERDRRLTELVRQLPSHSKTP
jgi:hypothetical protein